MNLGDLRRTKAIFFRNARLHLLRTDSHVVVDTFLHRFRPGHKMNATAKFARTVPPSLSDSS
jgi:hypothetical protein